MTPKEFEERCKQLVAIATVTSMLVMFPTNILSMFLFYIKLDKMFNSIRIVANVRRRIHTNQAW